LYKTDEWRKFSPEEISNMDGDKATQFYPKLIAILDALGV
jgi:hypothetical protein